MSIAASKAGAVEISRPSQSAMMPTLGVGAISVAQNGALRIYGEGVLRASEKTVSGSGSLGSALTNSGTITITTSTTFSKNSTTSSATPITRASGAVHNTGNLNLAGPSIVFSENTANAYSPKDFSANTVVSGGAILNVGGMFTIQNASLLSNSANSIFQDFSSFWGGTTRTSLHAAGAIYNSGSGIIIGTIFAYNSAKASDNYDYLTSTKSTAAYSAGAIINTGTLSISNATFANNTASASASTGNSFAAGAIYNSGSLTLSNSTFTKNSGSNGAIYSTGGTVSVNVSSGGTSLFSGNGRSFTFNGGALNITNSGTLDMRDPVFGGVNVYHYGTGTWKLGGKSEITGTYFNIYSGGTLHLYRSGEVSNATNSAPTAIVAAGAIALTRTTDNPKFTLAANATLSIGGGNTISAPRGEIVFSSGSILNFDMTSATSNQARLILEGNKVSGEIGTIHLENATTLTNGIYELINAAGSTTTWSIFPYNDNLALYVDGIQFSNGKKTRVQDGTVFSYRLNYEAKKLTVEKTTESTPYVANLTWNGKTDSTWTHATNKANWQGDADILTPTYRNADSVTFDDSSSKRTISISNNGVQPYNVTVDNRGENYVFTGGSINSTGMFKKLGTGAVSLSGTHHFSRGFALEQGTLRIGNPASSYTPQTLTLSGGVQLSAGTTLAYNIFYNNRSDRLIVDSLTLTTTGKVHVSINQTIAGTYTLITSNNALEQGLLTSNPDTIFDIPNLTSGHSADFNYSTDGRSLELIIERQNNGGGGNSGGGGTAFGWGDQTQLGCLAALTALPVNSAHSANNNVREHLNEWRTMKKTPPNANENSPETAINTNPIATENEKLSAYFQTQIFFSKTTNKDIFPFNTQIIGAAAGLDYKFSNEFMAGISLGGNSGRATNDFGGKLAQSQFHAIAYASGNISPKFHLDTTLHIGYSSYDAKLYMDDGLFSWKPKGFDIGSSISLNYDTSLGNGLSLTPHIGFDYVRAQVSQNNAFPYHVDSFAQNSLRFGVGSALAWQPMPRLCILLNLDFTHELCDSDVNISFRRNDNGKTFHQNIGATAKSLLRVGPSLAFAITPESLLSARYTFESAFSRQNAHNLQVAYIWRF